MLPDTSISNDKFCTMLDACLNDCEYFTLTRSSYTYEEGYIESVKQVRGNKIIVVDLKAEFSDFLLNDYDTRNWYGYLMPRFLNDGFFLNVSVYRFNNITKSKIKNTFPNIFLRDENHVFLYEDICFFENGKLLLGTVSHAAACTIYPTSEAQLLKFKELASWNEIPYHNFEHLRLSILLELLDQHQQDKKE